MAISITTPQKSYGSCKEHKTYQGKLEIKCCLVLWCIATENFSHESILGVSYF